MSTKTIDQLDGNLAPLIGSHLFVIRQDRTRQVPLSTLSAFLFSSPQFTGTPALVGASLVDSIFIVDQPDAGNVSSKRSVVQLRKAGNTNFQLSVDQNAVYLEALNNLPFRFYTAGLLRATLDSLGILTLPVSPIIPTVASSSDNSQKAASTAFVQSVVAPINANISAISAALGGYIPPSHSFGISDINGLPTALAGLQPLLGFPPVERGTGVGQLTSNTVKIGWSLSSVLRATVDSVDLGVVWTDSAITAAPDTYRSALKAEPLGLSNGIDQKTTSYVLAVGDGGRILEMNVGVPNTVTIPTNATVPIPIRSVIEITQTGPGQTSILPALGVTINSAGGMLKIATQWSGVVLYKRGINDWVLLGSLAP